MTRSALFATPLSLVALVFAACGLAACGGAAAPFDQKEPPPHGGGAATGGLVLGSEAAASAAPAGGGAPSFMSVGDITRAEVPPAAPMPEPTTTATATPPTGGPMKTAGKNEKGYKTDGGGVPQEKKPTASTTPLPPADGVRGAVVDSASGLTEAEVRQTIMSKSSAFRECYDLGGAAFSGSISLRVAIGPTGTVAMAEVTASTTHVAQVDSCVLSKIRTMQFPSKGTGAIISFPIEFGR